MGGLINFDFLYGGRDNTFGIFGVGLSNYKVEFGQYEKDFGLGVVLRAGGGFAHNLKNNTYLFANILGRYSLKSMEENFGLTKISLGNLFAIGVNAGVAF